MRVVSVTSAIALVMALCAGATRLQAGQTDRPALADFQRAADAYAFQHRQVQRRLGGTPDAKAMAAAMRAARPAAVDGALFTPLVAAAFRTQISAAFHAGCGKPEASALNFVVPRVHEDAGTTVPLADCLKAILPKLPAELEYRAAGVTLVLVDTHAQLVVDVLHGAFP